MQGVSLLNKYIVAYDHRGSLTTDVHHVTSKYHQSVNAGRRSIERRKIYGAFSTKEEAGQFREKVEAIRLRREISFDYAMDKAAQSLKALVEGAMA